MYGIEYPLSKSNIWKNLYVVQVNYTTVEYMSYRQFLVAVESAFRAKGCLATIKNDVLLAKCLSGSIQMAYVVERDLEGFIRLSLLTDDPVEGAEGDILDYNFSLYGVKVMRDSEGFLVLAFELPEDCAMLLGAGRLLKEAERLSDLYRKVRDFLFKSRS